jgi:cytochrome c-type biogenesis protein CcsB
MDTTLAQYANLSLYSAMAVLTLSMIGYALYLAGLVPARVDSRDRAEVLVGGEPTAFEPNAGSPAAAVEAPERARRAAGIAGSLAVLGTVLLVAGVALRGASVHRWPLGNMHEFATFASACVLLTFVVWGTRRDLRWLGLFVTGPVLLVLGLAVTVWYTPAAELLPSLKSYWLVIHVTVATIATAVFGLGAAMTGLSLWQDRVESRGGRSFMERLPSSRVLERLAYGMHVIAFPLWTFTLIAGAIWARQAWGSYWNWDPKEVWTFVIWVVYAAYLHARATSGWSRAQASWIAIAGFGCILVNYGVVNVWFVSQHSYSGL